MRYFKLCFFVICFLMFSSNGSASDCTDGYAEYKPVFANLAAKSAESMFFVDTQRVGTEHYENVWAILEANAEGPIKYKRLDGRIFIDCSTWMDKDLVSNLTRHAEDVDFVDNAKKSVERLRWGYYDSGVLEGVLREGKYKALIIKLLSTNWRDRRDAESELKKIGKPVVPELEAAYYSIRNVSSNSGTKVFQRYILLQVLEAINGKARDVVLLDILMDLSAAPSSGERSDLLQIPSEELLIDIISHAFFDDNDANLLIEERLVLATGEYRKRLIILSGFAGSVEHSNELIGLFRKDKNPYIRKLSMEALEKIIDKKVFLGLLEDALKDPYFENVKKEVSNKREEAIFKKYYGDKGRYYSVRQRAVNILKKYGVEVEQLDNYELKIKKSNNKVDG